MLNQVPAAFRIAARAMVTRHPNAMECQVWRKTVTRTAGAESGQEGGLPTLGGLAVLKADDEAELDYVLLGNGHVLFAGVYEGTSLSDARDNAEAEPSAIANALIEPETAGAFEPKTSDLVMVMPGAGVVLTYEVTKVLNTINIPPYMPKYELSSQGDLMFVPGVAASQAARP